MLVCSSTARLITEWRCVNNGPAYNTWSESQYINTRTWAFSSVISCEDNVEAMLL